MSGNKKFNGLDPFRQIINDLEISPKRLVEMWCELNRWKIPKEFENEIIVHEFSNSEKGMIAMRDIELIVGTNKCLAEWRRQSAPELVASEEIENYINSLKEELKRERDSIDKYAWSVLTRDLARETQAQRKVVL